MIALVAIAMFAKGRFFVSWDLSTYLAYADNLVSDRELVDATGTSVSSRAFYIFMLAGLQAVFGKSLLAVSLFETLLSAALAVTVFALTRQMFDVVAAFAVTLLFIFTPGMMFWLPRHVDPVWPIFVTLSFLTWLSALDHTPEARARWSLLILSGALAAIGIKTKEMATLFLLVPITASVLDAKARDWRNAALFLTATAISYLLLTKLLTTGAENTVIQENHIAALGRRIGGWGLEGLGRLFRLSVLGLANYFHSSAPTVSLSAMVPVWWLGLAGLLVQGLLAIKKNRNALYVVLLALAFLPFAAYAGMWIMRPSQNLMFIISLYLAIGGLFSGLVGFLSGMVRKAVAYAAIACLVIVLTGYQVWADERNTRLFKRDAFVARLFKGQYGFAAQTRGEDLARWIADNPDVLKQNGGIIITDVVEQNHVSWRLAEPPEIYNPPFQQLGDGIHWPYYTNTYPAAERPAIVAITNWRPPYPQTPLFQLTKAAFDDFVKKKGVRLIAVRATPFGKMVVTWIDTNFELMKLAEIGPARLPTGIFLISGPKADDAGILSVDQRVGAYLGYVKRTEPWRYEAMREQLLKATLHLSDREINTLLASGSRKPGFVEFDREQISSDREHNIIPSAQRR